jgi:hypothetical protein
MKQSLKNNVLKPYVWLQELVDLGQKRALRYKRDRATGEKSQ